MHDPTLLSVGGRKLMHGGEPIWWFGCNTRQLRSDAENAVADAQRARIPRIQIIGDWDVEANDRYPLWSVARKVLNRPLKYNHQVTGSCVGAGGGNALKTTICCDIAAGDREEYREVWWPFTYGRSRFRCGLSTPGEGSTGEAWAEAVVQDGFLDSGELGLPPLPESAGWLKLSASTEQAWSDGDSKLVLDWMIKAKEHTAVKMGRCLSSADVLAAHANGYAITLASMFGLGNMVPAPQGNPAVRLGKWDGSWAHQMYSDESWQHPSLGLIHRIGNNWGDVHGAPTGDEPAGGFYIASATMDKVCDQGEVYALAGVKGFQARDWIIDWRNH